MRLSHVIWVIAATVVAICDATTESSPTKLSQATTAGKVQAVEIDSPSKRFLRTGKTATAEEKDERAFPLLKKLKLKLPKYRGSPVGKDGKFTANYVKALLKHKKFRRTTFEGWAKSEIDAKYLKQSLGGLSDKDRVELFNRNTAYTGQVERKPGNNIVGGWDHLVGGCHRIRLSSR